MKYWVVVDEPLEPGNAAAVRRHRDRQRKKREREKKKELESGAPMPAVRPNGGRASRKLKEEAMAELVVVRRCWDCGQAFEAKVKDEECPWCQT